MPPWEVAVTRRIAAKEKLDLPNDFTVTYAAAGSAALDNLPFNGVESLIIQDRHPMWVEPKTPAIVGYEDASPDGLQYGRIVLSPEAPDEVLEVLVTGYRVIPEILALRPKFRLKLYSPERVVVKMQSGTHEYRDIDFVACTSKGGIAITFEAPQAFSKAAHPDKQEI